MFAVIAVVFATATPDDGQRSGRCGSARRTRREGEERTADLTRTLQRKPSPRSSGFRDLVNCPEGIVWEQTRAQLQFTFVSGQAERLLGYPVQQWLSEPSFWKITFHADDRASHRAELSRDRAAAARGHDFEYRMIAASGESVWLRESGQRPHGREPGESPCAA
jgi:PAS domain-containing protein